MGLLDGELSDRGRDDGGQPRRFHLGQLRENPRQGIWRHDGRFRLRLLIGINYYSEHAVEFDRDSPERFRFAPSWQATTDMGWEVVPEGLYRMIMAIAKRWPVKKLYVTENGATYPDTVESSGRVRDVERIAYLRSHIAACRRAVAEGAPLKGYYVWSLMDNFEWSFGYTKRFGLVHVDPRTGKRLPKDSYWFYRDLVAGNEP